MAGDAVSVRVHGLDALTASLDRLAGDLEDLAPEAAAREIGKAAQMRAPKRTGRLAASLSTDSSAGRISVQFGAPHAGALNFGTGPRVGLRGPHNIRATRFLTGTVRDREDAWMKDYSDAAQDAVDKVKGA